MPTTRAPAKINLRLKVTGRRPDGYHLLDMIMVKLDLADEIEWEIVPEGVAIDLVGAHLGAPQGGGAASSTPTIPCDKSNTLWKTAEAVQRESGKKFGVKISLKKNIPTAAGLGGGSSDAAALLTALNRELKLGWAQKRLIQIGVKIGADVPFFLVKGPQKVGGIGEKLTPYPCDSLPLILINPGFPVSTAEAYRWYDKNPPNPPLTKGGQGGISDDRSALTLALPDGTRLPLENDLERVVIPRYPVLARIKDLLSEAGAPGTLMSGSGSTVFGLFNSAASRDRGYEFLLKAKDPTWWLWRGKAL